jgi:hypothetical protein
MVLFLFKTHNVLETGIVLCLQEKPNQLGPIDRATPYFQSIDWAQLSRFYLKTETKSSLRNVVFEIKTGRWIMSTNIIFV